MKRPSESAGKPAQSRSWWIDGKGFGSKRGEPATA
jgi:hypothetical protein